LARNKSRAAPPAGEDSPALGIDPEVPSDLSENPDGCPVNLRQINMRLTEDLAEWSSPVKDLFKLRVTFTDLGRHLLGLISTMPTPLGNFTRSFCLAAQPLTTGGADSKESHGDLLPIPVWRIGRDIADVTDDNIDWLKVLVSTINFQYCTGWAKPICVPAKDNLSSLQRDAISRMARVVDSNILTSEQLLPFGECDKLLSSKKYDYRGDRWSTWRTSCARESSRHGLERDKPPSSHWTPS